MQRPLQVLRSLLSLILAALDQKYGRGQVVVVLNGGMGNQMFQVAAAYAFAKRQRKQLLILKDTTYRNTYWSQALHSFADCQVPMDSVDKIKSRPRVVYKEVDLQYRPIPNDATWLEGYFQSQKFFDDCQDEIRAKFQAPSAVETLAKLRHPVLFDTKSNRDKMIAVHIRRQDFTHEPDSHGILDAGYFKGAVNRAQAMVPDSQLVVFSDDVEWCKRQSFLSQAIIVNEPNDALGLFLMTQFNNYVISNSSFSWWAVFLAHPKGIVIAPNRWMGLKGPAVLTDVYDPRWLKHPVTLLGTVEERRGFVDRMIQQVGENLQEFVGVMQSDSMSSVLKFEAALTLGKRLISQGQCDEGLVFLEKTAEYDSSRLDGIAAAAEYHYGKGAHDKVYDLWRRFARHESLVDARQLKGSLDYFNQISAFYAGHQDDGFKSVRAIIEGDDIQQQFVQNALSNVVFYGKQIEGLGNEDKRRLLWAASRVCNSMLGRLGDGQLGGFSFILDRCQSALFEAPLTLAKEARQEKQGFLAICLHSTQDCTQAKRTLCSMAHCFQDFALADRIIVHGAKARQEEWAEFFPRVQVMQTDDVEQVRSAFPSQYWLETSDACLYVSEGFFVLDAIEAIANTGVQAAYVGQPLATSFKDQGGTRGRQFCQHHVLEEDDKAPVALVRAHTIKNKDMANFRRIANWSSTAKFSRIAYLNRIACLVKETNTCDIPVIVINLKRRADRREAMESQLKSAGFTNVTFFEAVDGSKIAATPEIVRLFSGNDFCSRKGVIGCAMSHYTLWQKIAQGHYGDGGPFFVLEDDVTFGQYAAKVVHEIRNECAKEDMVLLGYHAWWDPPRTAARHVKLTDLKKSNYMGAAYSYLITRRGAYRSALWIDQNGIKQGFDMLFAFQIPIRLKETEPHIVFSQRDDTNIQRSQERFDIPSIGVEEIKARFERYDKTKCCAKVEYTVPHGFYMALTRAHLDHWCVAFSSKGEVFYKCDEGDLVPSSEGEVFVRKQRVQ